MSLLDLEMSMIRPGRASQSIISFRRLRELAAGVVAPPRIGGLLLLLFGLSLAPLWPSTLVSTPPGVVIAAVMPLLALAAWDDLVGPVSPSLRLLASLFAGAAFVFLTNTTLDAAQLPELGFLLRNRYAAGVATILLIAAVTNGFNLIDGVNGLSAAIFAHAAMVMGIVSGNMGLDGLSDILIAASASSLIFLLFNFPSGKIFLGDLGAYLLGFVAVACGIMLILASDSRGLVSLLLILFWPCFEIVTTVVRRLHAGRSIMRPDMLHTHLLVFRLLRSGGLQARPANNLAALICFAASVPPTLVGGFVELSTAGGLICLSGFAAAYAALRAACPSIARGLAARRRRRRAILVHRVLSRSQSLQSQSAAGNDGPEASLRRGSLTERDLATRGVARVE